MAARVLLVEDDIMNKKVLKLLLEKKGKFEVILSEDPLEIFSLVRDRKVDLLLLDVSLSNSFLDGEEIDGLKISNILKSDSSTSWIPIILSTAHAMKGDCERFLEESGADDYIPKPIEDTDKFINKVREAINTSQTSM